MTNSIDNGWPDKYSDPRDRPYPALLRVTVESFETMQEDTLDAVEKIADGESQPALVSFATVGNLRKILTNRRIELLQYLIDIDGAAESITAVANELERDYRTVHDDVSLLADHGLLLIIDEGKSKRPYVPYERIHLDVELAGLSAGESSALA
jgi:predicted transcriptional regulator